MLHLVHACNVCNARNEVSCAIGIYSASRGSKSVDGHSNIGEHRLMNDGTSLSCQRVSNVRNASRDDTLQRATYVVAVSMNMPVNTLSLGVGNNTTHCG